MLPSEAERALFDLAQEQGGFFTSKQAAQIGYTANKRNYHIKAGNWIREYRGIFRLALYPPPERPDLVLWWLWSRGRDDAPRGVFSHMTALSLHELTDVNPAKIDLTVPPSFRKGTPIPSVLALHFADVRETERQTIHGVPVTRALRTIVDVWPTAGVPAAQLRAALENAQRTGTITRHELAEARRNPAYSPILVELESGGA